MPPSTYWMLDAGIRDLKITTDLASKEFVDFWVSWNGGALPGCRVDVDRVTRALSQQAAAL